MSIALAARNSAARGIWSDGEAMWVLDGGKDSLFAYDLASGDLLGEYELASANGDPHGIFFDGVTFWVSDHVEKRLFAYRLEAGENGADALERNRDEEFPDTVLSRASNNSPRGLWSDGGVMYVADESDARVYTYNMPGAVDARLASLSLSGVDIGEFSPNHEEYEGSADEGVSETTVTALAMQRLADVDIDPPDADAEAEGHQVALGRSLAEITVTVTSGDGSAHARLPHRVRAGGAGAGLPAGRRGGGLQHPHLRGGKRRRPGRLRGEPPRHGALCARGRRLRLLHPRGAGIREQTPSSSCTRRASRPRRS